MATEPPAVHGSAARPDPGLVRALDALAGRAVNYDPADAPASAADPRWHVDDVETVVGREAPGDPEPGGAWEAACAILRAYAFTDHRRIRGVYRPSAPLLGRDMLLQGRFTALRFHVGVRVTGVVDTRDDGRRIWGWTYETLTGHLEQGRLTYEVVKDTGTGEVTFRIHAFSRRATVRNPVYRAGMRVFGRPIQVTFYRRVGERMRDLVRSGHAPLPPDEDVVVVPAGSPAHWWDRFALVVPDPGR